jgi:WD40 repeat protein
MATFREMATFRGFRQDPHSLTISPDGQRLAAGSDGKEAIKLFDMTTHQELLTLEGEGGYFRARFSRDGNILGATSDKGLLHLWSAPSLAEIEAAEKQSE